MTRTLTAAALCLALALPANGQEAADKTKVDKAVDRALEFLADNQHKDGSWNTGGRNPAFTALCVMAFLSAGHVPGEGKYGNTIKKGVTWVLQQQTPNGLIASDAAHEMYEHGICTLMLAEVAGMTDGKLADEVRRNLVRAVEVILKGQRTEAGPDRGGWRYQVQHVNGSDMSVTGWQVMALRAAKNLGCDVPTEAIDNAIDYIKRSQDPNSGGFRYTPHGGTTIACTGTAILALELCGKEQHRSEAVLRAGSLLLRNPPRFQGGRPTPHFSYSIYYCSQACFQLGDNYWNHFRPQLHDVLLGSQTPNGSWRNDGDVGGGGAYYSTAMAVLALTVEYRYLPIYQRDEQK